MPIKTFNFVGGFIKDDFARRCESIQKRDFLFTGKRPCFGQRTETQISLSDGRWFRMSGEITEVLPSSEDFESSLGASNGQILIGVSELNFDFYDKNLPVKKGERWQIRYRMDKEMEFGWVVDSVIPL